MKIRRKMKKSYAKIALKVRLQRRLEGRAGAQSNERRMLPIIAATFRMYLALNCEKRKASP